ncbi:MAG: hypothetical protein ACREUK_07255 [Burkholderiales bacterium]
MISARGEKEHVGALHATPPMHETLQSTLFNPMAAAAQAQLLALEGLDVRR